MKHIALISFLFISSFCSGQLKKSGCFFSAGLDYRQYPIDIEDVPRGPLPPDKGLPSDDSKFWQALSIHGRYGFITERNWLLSVSFYTSYNLLHRLEGINYSTPFKKVKEKKNFKYDFFVDIEKKVRLKKNKERYFFAVAGIGLINTNSRFDVILTDTSEYGSSYTRHYKGTFLDFGLRISLGYQYKKIKTSLDAYVIEDPTLANLTSLWIGATISYEMLLRKKKK